jgi:hypothetical protein
MRQKRALFRNAIRRVGQVSRGPHVAWCEVVNLSEKGAGFSSEMRLGVGDDVLLEFDLTPKTPIHCTLRIVASSPPRVGGVFTAIAPKQRRAIAQFIEQQNALNTVAY